MKPNVERSARYKGVERCNIIKMVIALSLLIFLKQMCNAQNLLSNGDFELYYAWPNDYGQCHYSDGWNNVNNDTLGNAASPDFYHDSVSYLGVFGKLPSQSGSAQMGLYTYYELLGDAREYISTEIDQSLVAGQEYQISFYLTNGVGGIYKAAANNFGVNFSMTPLTQVKDEPIPVDPQIEIPYLIYHDSWKKYNFTFTPDSAVRFITFGNFRDDANTVVSGGTRAYYFIDNIVLIPCTDLSVSADSASGPEDVPMVLNILQNDTISQCHPASIQLLQPTSFKGGTVSINPDSTISYIPPVDFFGVDSFAYELCDQNVCDTAMVYLEIESVNDAPLVLNDTFSTSEDIFVKTLNILDNDTDSKDPSGGLDQNSLQVVSAPPNGQVFVDKSNGKLYYIPLPDFSGLDSLQYTMNDNGIPAPVLADSAWVYIYVNPSNDPPIANNDYVSLYEDNSITFNPFDNDSDSIDPTGTVDVTTLQVTEGPYHAIVSVDTLTGEVSYAPENNFYGKDSLHYTFYDKGILPVYAGDAWVYFDVLPVNDPPVTGSDFITTKQNITETFDAVLNDSDPLDPEGGIDASTIEVISAFAPSHGSLVKGPGSGELSYTPDPYYMGKDSAAYKVCDSGYPLPALCDTGWVYFNVTEGDSTILAFDDSIQLQEDANYIIINPEKNDYSSQGKVFQSGEFTLSTISGYLPQHGLLYKDMVVERFFYVPDENYNGADSMAYAICDVSTGMCDTALIFLDVAPVNDQPAVYYDYATISPDTGQIEIHVLNNDSDFRDPKGGIDTSSLLIVAHWDSTHTHGSATEDTTNGTILYTPDTSYLGKDTVKYWICDIGYPAPPICKIGLIIITITNNPGTGGGGGGSSLTLSAKDDSLLIFEDDTLESINPAENDFNYPVGVAGKYTLDTIPGAGPKHGQAFVSDASSLQKFFYIPVPGFFGIDSFQYVITKNSQVDSAWIYVNIQSVNDLPVILNDTLFTQTGVPVTGFPTSNDSDPEDAPVGNIDIASLTLSSGPYSGTLVLDTLTGEITYTPDSGFYGLDSMQYTVCDNGDPALCGSAWIFVEVDSVFPELSEDVIYKTIYISDSVDICIDVLQTKSSGKYSFELLNNPYKGTIAGSPYLQSCFIYASNGKFLGNDILKVAVYDSTTFWRDTLHVVINILPATIITVDDEVICDTGSVTIEILNNDTIYRRDETTITILDSVENGTLSINSDGSIAYVPGIDSCSYEQFTYSLCHPMASCDTATVYIQIVPKDSDGDGLPDYIETTYADSDSDGIPNYLSTDSDGDYILDMDEGNQNGNDVCNIELFDCDRDGIPDYLEEEPCTTTVVSEEEQFMIPEGFSPDGNGINDYFEISKIEDYPENSIIIFNRWGNKVYQRSPYTNDWGGTCEFGPTLGENLPEGTYFYIFNFGNDKDVIKGYVYLKRN